MPAPAHPGATVACEAASSKVLWTCTCHDGEGTLRRDGDQMRIQAEERIDAPTADVFRFVAVEHFANHHSVSIVGGHSSKGEPGSMLAPRRGVHTSVPDRPAAKADVPSGGCLAGTQR
jgi:hypothetical protein